MGQQIVGCLTSSADAELPLALETERLIELN
jgi:hypothetical protein